MKPHILLYLRDGVPHRKLGSWLRAIKDSHCAGPPFQPDIDHVLSSVRGGVMVTNEYEPASDGGWSLGERRLGLDRVFRVVLQSGVLPDGRLLRELEALPQIERAVHGLVATSRVPLASASSRQPADWPVEAVGIGTAHEVTRGNPDVVIAVLDTGVAHDHPEYASRLRKGFDFVDIIDGAAAFMGDVVNADPDPTDPGVGHGSHVTGILAATGKRMMSGVAPECTILPVRVLGALRQDEHLIGAGLVDNINAGIKWAVDQGADVINMSLGIRRQGGGLPHAELIKYAQLRGVAVVAASGNDGADTLYYPGALPGVIAVGAVGRDDQVAGYSTWGAQVDIVAPGTEIWSSWLNGDYAFATGTSQATPFVSGAAALCQSVARSFGRRLSVDEVTDALLRTADRQDRHLRTTQRGWGRLNIRDALRLTTVRLQSRVRPGLSSRQHFLASASN
jgi:thermitase